MTDNTAVRRILFITGTRADFGKLKPLIKAVDDSDHYACTVFATGMHTLELYGNTIYEVQRSGFRDVHVFMNQIINEPMDLILANTVSGLSRFVHQNPPDLIVVHGDRIEALAGAIVGSLRNVLVGHIEGGELSGTIDDLIRHAVSKLSHLHFVANGDAKSRLEQMGEQPETIFVIGSPDIDIMTSPDLPSLEDARSRYQIPFERYGVAIFHPVTTEIGQIKQYAGWFVDALIESGRDYVVVLPNNDEGAIAIIDQYERLQGHPRFRLFPSIRFEFFLTLLKNAEFVIGNSSAGVREAPFYGLPTVNIGTRQNGRFDGPTVVDTGYEVGSILDGLARTDRLAGFGPDTTFGTGNSRQLFMDTLADARVWGTPKQKLFRDLDPTR